MNRTSFFDGKKRRNTDDPEMGNALKTVNSHILDKNSIKCGNFFPNSDIFLKKGGGLQKIGWYTYKRGFLEILFTNTGRVL